MDKRNGGANNRARGQKPSSGKPSAGKYVKKTYTPKSKSPFDKPPRTRSADKKPFEKKPYAERAQGEHAFERKPYDKGTDKKSYAKKPYEKKPYEKKPYEKKPYNKKPYQREPDGERASANPPREGAPQARKPLPPKPFERKPFADRAQGDRAQGERAYNPPRGNVPIKQMPLTPKPFVRKPFVDRGAPRQDIRTVAESTAFTSAARIERPTDSSAPSGYLDARRVALNALSDVERVDAYAALALDKRLRESRLTPEDKRLATSIFYAAIENKLNIEYVLKQFAQSEPEPIIHDILVIACAQILFMDRIPDHAAVDEAVKQARAFRRDEATGFVNGTLRSLLRARDAGEIAYPDAETEPIKYMSIIHSMPENIITRLIEAYGFETAREIVCFRPHKRYETIRPNYLRTDDAAFAEYLSARGFEWSHGAAQGAFLVERAGSLATDPDYYNGMFSVQGESSMLAARAVEPKPGMTILDACAAPGGKAALIGELMHGTGRVHAWDIHEHRVELIKATARRLRLDNLRPAMRDASITREDIKSTMDAVLIDAPCSGLGVMTDKPDIKYRVTDESINELIQIQKSILNACAPYVRAGGLLVYSTCSILPVENEVQIDAFLRAHPEYKLETDDKYLPEPLRAHLKRGMLTLLPGANCVEGFFIARMRRVNLP